MVDVKWSECSAAEKNGIMEVEEGAREGWWVVKECGWYCRDWCNGMIMIMNMNKENNNNNRDRNENKGNVDNSNCGDND